MRIVKGRWAVVLAKDGTYTAKLTELPSWAGYACEQPAQMICDRYNFEDKKWNERDAR